jgi:uridine phosphorylase
MIMIPSELGYLARTTHAAEVPFSDSALYRLYQSTLPDQNSTISLAGPFVGSPHAVIAMEKLIAMGVTRVWALGWCGSLQPWLPVGSIILPNSAVSEEGTSRHYPVAAPPRSDDKLMSIVEKALDRVGIAYAKGPVWTTDAPYRETLDKVDGYQRRGVLGVEMEMSALMTLAVYRGVSMAGLLVVSDELAGLKWKPGFSDPVLKQQSRTAAKALLQAVAPLGQGNGTNAGNPIEM